MKSRDYFGNLVFIAILAWASACGAGICTWTGGAAPDDNWGTAGNWLSSQPPAVGGGDTVYFNNTDVGNTNLVNQDWTVTGMRYANSTPGSAHITDLATHTLVVTSQLSLGDGTVVSVSNTRAVITNGTIQLGTAGSALTSYIGRNEGVADVTNLYLGIAGTVNATNVAMIAVGYSESYQNTAEGTLDLRNATIASGGAANTLRMGDLLVGAGNVIYAIRYVKGTLLLPASLTELTVNNLTVTYGIYANPSIVDFGVNSQLRNLTAKTGFYLGCGNTGTLTNLPSNVHLTIGQPGVPAPMHLVSVQASYASYGNLTLASGSIFTAYLSEFRAADVRDSTYGAGPETGILDLRNATVDVFSVTGNAFIGADALYGNFNGKGYVYLPACTVNVVSNLNVGDTANTSFGLLELDGTQFTIGKTLTIDITGVVSNHVQGVSSGIDLASNNQSDFVIASGGKMNVKFDANPVDPSHYYWGLRMRGNNVSYFQSLTNSAAIVVDASGLSSDCQKRCGVYYHAADNITYIGLEPCGGTVITIR